MAKKTTKFKKNEEIQRRKPKQARALEKYNAVLDACTQVLLSQGYRKTTILELSLEADVAVPTLYQYFENKDAIFVAWINRVMDQVLGSVAFQESQLKDKHIDTHVDSLMNTALTAVSFYRPGLQQLLGDVPNALSSRIIHTMETKTLEALEALFPYYFSEQSPLQDIRPQVLTLIRVITGYFIQSILNNERDIESTAEAIELATLVKLYLTHHNIHF